VQRVGDVPDEPVSMRDLGRTPRVKAYFVAPPAIESLARSCGSRTIGGLSSSNIKTEDELGLDHCEGRSYLGRNRQVLLTALAHGLRCCALPPLRWNAFDWGRESCMSCVIDWPVPDLLARGVFAEKVVALPVCRWPDGPGHERAPTVWQRFPRTLSTQRAQNVHSYEQMRASSETGDRALLRCSQVGRSSSIVFSS
jgi:hypothetical protein